MPGEGLTLAQRVREKNPGSYDDMTDEQLEAAITRRYPGVYDDLRTANEVDSEAGSPLAGILAAATAKATPALAGVVNRGAKAVGALAASHPGRLVKAGGPAFVAYDAATDLLSGDTGGAAKKVAGAAAVASVPAIASHLQRATAPAGGVARGAMGRFISGQGGPLTRAATTLSRNAGVLGVVADAIFGPGAAGHRPPGETAETTAERQREFERRYAALARGSK